MEVINHLTYFMEVFIMKKTKANWKMTTEEANEAIEDISVLVSDFDSDDLIALFVTIMPEVYAGVKKHKRLSYKAFKRIVGGKLTKKDKRLYDKMVKAVKKVTFK